MDIRNPIDRQRIEDEIEAQGSFHDPSIMLIAFYLEGSHARDLEHLQSLPHLKIIKRAAEGIGFTFSDAPDWFDAGYGRVNPAEGPVVEPNPINLVQPRTPFLPTGAVAYFGPRNPEIVPYLGRVLDHLQQNPMSLYGYATNMRGAVVCFAGKDVQAGEANTDFRKSLADVVGVN